jgi:hypothetical protein
MENDQAQALAVLMESVEGARKNLVRDLASAIADDSQCSPKQSPCRSWPRAWSARVSKHRQTGGRIADRSPSAVFDRNVFHLAQSVFLETAAQ